ncbi:MAG: polysaccharide export protein [Bacteroidales bacterium]|nr:polysaccharide export protein [Bacteroidales bacterium]
MTFTQKAGSLLAVSLVLFGCSTPKNIAYMQDSYNDAIVETIKANPIRLKPMDKISIVVNSRDPQIATMFNLIYTSVHLGAGTSLNGGLSTGGQMILPYTVDKDGEIDFPVLGKVKVAGLTRAETADHIKNLLIASNQIKDPVVTVDFMNLGFSILGEVSRPGRYRIDRDAFTILDAISQAGDLTINGQRENVTLIRNYGTAQEIFYKMNLTDTEDIFSSPAYYLEQGDIVYVTPNPKRRRESTVSANSAFTPSFWISLASTATSITSAILVIVRTSK